MQILKSELKEKIIVESRKYFYEKGFENASMRNIAKEVGISPSNLYRYFENKADLFSRVIGGYDDIFVNKIESIFSKDHNAEDIPFFKIISNELSNIILFDKIKFILIMDKSSGTKYEEFKDKLTLLLANHIDETTTFPDIRDSQYIVKIIANNFINGLLEIAKHFEDKDDIQKNTEILIKYHLEGIQHFF